MACCCGSSPPPWGTRETSGASGAPTTVHPHPHGEHPLYRPWCVTGNGSSPPAWGTRPIAARPSDHVRFIPTRMGNTIAQILSTVRTSVHPHPHGEHTAELGAAFLCADSSPPAWGTRAEAALAAPALRFIPTRMGNTGSRFRSLGVPAVHPHPHGEHSSPYIVEHGTGFPPDPISQPSRRVLPSIH